MMMQWVSGYRFDRLSGKEPLIVELLADLLRASGVESFHFHELFRRQIFQPPDEVHELPGVEISAAARSPRGHARQSDAVFYDPIEFAVRKLLSFFKAHVGNFGVEALAHLSLAAAVVGVARGAMIGEMSARLSPDLRGK